MREGRWRVENEGWKMISCDFLCIMNHEIMHRVDLIRRRSFEDRRAAGMRSRLN